MKILSSRFHERPMAYATIGAVLAAVGGSVVPHWFAYAACAASLPLVVFLFHRRNTAFLLPLALMMVLVRMLLLPTSIPADSGVGLFLHPPLPDKWMGLQVRVGLERVSEAATSRAGDHKGPR